MMRSITILPSPLMGEGTKGPVPVLDTGSEGDSSLVIADLIRNPEGRMKIGATVILDLIQNPQGGEVLLSPSP